MQKKIYFTHNKENSIHNVVSVLMFQQLLANKHQRLRDSKFGGVEVWVCLRTKLKEKPRVNQDPRRPMAA